jgi:hypothetical protein
MKYLLIVLAIITFSCNWAKEKTKNAVNKTGEVVAKTGAEFAQGVSKGIEKTFQNEVEIADPLKKQGVSTGKIIITSTDSSTDNVVTAYLIFDKDFDQNIRVRVLDNADNEYGRTTQRVTSPAGEAKYIDFVFDKRTNIDSKGKLIFE